MLVDYGINDQDFNQNPLAGSMLDSYKIKANISAPLKRRERVMRAMDQVGNLS